MKLLKYTFLSFIYSALILLFTARNAQAAKNYKTNLITTITISEKGDAEVIHRFEIENLVSEVYASNFYFLIKNADPKNMKVYEGKRISDFVLKKNDNQSEIDINFKYPVVGINNIKEFSIIYNDSSFIEKTGEIWEVSIPKLGDSKLIDDYKLTLVVSKNLGNLSYVSPSPGSYKSINSGSYHELEFTDGNLNDTGITAGFGDYQVFSFSINYHLENPLKKDTYFEIAIPPDTAYQKVYYQSMDPKPSLVKKDINGNWLSEYKIPSRGRIDIEISGYVQIFSKPWRIFEETQESLNNSLKHSQFWQINDKKIKEIANSLGSEREIYDYVVENLNYSYERVAPNAERLGAVAALENPNKAICTEFTDLFITLSRAKGIPAREINGFAYTENPKIQPLSLVSDVLHAWPEYWDDDEKVWKAVDPTWGYTTGGADYFSSLDLRHFVFVIHSDDPNKPYPPGSYKLGENPQKDVYINFGKIPESYNNFEPKVELKSKKSSLFLDEILLIVSNPGSEAVYDVDYQINLNGEKRVQKIDVILPFSSYSEIIKANFSASEIGSDKKIEILFDGKSYTTTLNSRRYLLLIIVFSTTLILIVASSIYFLNKYRKSKIKYKYV